MHRWRSNEYFDFLCMNERIGETKKNGQQENERKTREQRAQSTLWNNDRADCRQHAGKIFKSIFPVTNDYTENEKKKEKTRMKKIDLTCSDIACTIAPGCCVFSFFIVTENPHFFQWQCGPYGVIQVLMRATYANEVQNVIRRLDGEI